MKVSFKTRLNDHSNLGTQAVLEVPMATLYALMDLLRPYALLTEDDPGWNVSAYRDLHWLYYEIEEALDG